MRGERTFCSTYTHKLQTIIELKDQPMLFFKVDHKQAEIFPILRTHFGYTFNPHT